MNAIDEALESARGLATIAASAGFRIDRSDQDRIVLANEVIRLEAIVALNVTLLAIAQRAEAMLSAQGWLPDGYGAESELLRDARATIAAAKGEKP